MQIIRPDNFFAAKLSFWVIVLQILQIVSGQLYWKLLFQIKLLQILHIVVPGWCGWVRGGQMKFVKKFHDRIFGPKVLHTKSV